MYVSVTLRNVAVNVTQECRCVMFAGLGILRILRVKGQHHIIAQKEGGAWERTPQVGPFSHGGGEGRCRAFSEACCGYVLLV